MMNEEEDKIEDILQKSTPPKNCDSFDYKININMSKKISQLKVEDDTSNLRTMCENYAQALENDAHRLRAKQKKRYDEWFDNLEKDCYPARDIVNLYNMFFGHELPISRLGFGHLDGTKRHFTHKKVKRNNKFITMYYKKNE